jgi:hypothetical protein
MNYFQINLMPRENSEYCFLHAYPEGLGIHTYKLAEGEPVGAEYPTDACIYMDPKEKGIELPSLIGNTCSMLLVDRPTKEVIEQINKAQTQYLPVKIYNHKKRLASADYFIVNPLGTYDCLDTKQSGIEYEDGEVVDVDEEALVLDRKKMKKAPALFRVREDPGIYVVSEDIVDAWIALEPRPTNVNLWDLDFAD